MKDKDIALAYLNRNRILNIGMLQVLRRGTAEILCAYENGVYLRDTVSDAYMLSTDDAAAGIEWMAAFESRSYSLMQICNKEAVEHAKRKYGFETELICVQAIYEGQGASQISDLTAEGKETAGVKEKEDGKDGSGISNPENPGKLVICEPDDATMELIQHHYDKISEEELWQIRRLHNLYAGYLDGVCVGFIGSHLEGSMGLLEVLPAYRRRGYAVELEQFMIAHMHRQGLFAFAQIETWNEKSLNLQKKLGMQISEEKVYWLF
ncbi:GNAT family N-acetyltransferase [Parablautia sp. Marseille-Q6255]|uniref:GNAT family N-acetyltransferase n=1 Tax=Parablautia sp. Marseille-Q6255 TaxID=3039593 RepID=UPI0024BC66A8|nr:GNAT family N-acetyltransferase [Parablautia sp. Marseille-Q6255]